MANLKYKTRGDSRPQGKPRVYFCCHPDDFSIYFESVSDEILAKQNCTIWYTDEVITHDEDFFADLKQMQLFVMPVTANLLCTENKALCEEFKFAIENHIPVLPLMQEKGLEELFNEKCGDLQFLDKSNTDITAISYDEKLKKYLESVLIGDELAKKIRAAFDAYVFLSYRKKDRKYAQELMRLIHKNDFCRDIAIWYDEFLTPGENFNDSIKEALQKSGLFVLAVTPNLVNEPNYIMTTEYPMAKQEGKPILPAELVPTDRKQLSEMYEDIPSPSDAHNETELSEVLFESIKKIAIKESPESPEHNFFIGLAYLGGIDVEVDHDKALALITCAAEDNLVEAAEKLVHMYKIGEGVSLDSKKSIQWRRTVNEMLENIFIESPSNENALKLLRSLQNYYNYSMEIGDIDDIKDSSSKYFLMAFDISEHKITNDEEIELFSLDSFLKLSYVNELHGDITDAGSSYSMLLSQIEDYIQKYKSPMGIELLGICLQRLGEINKKIGNYEEALKHIKKAAFHFKKLSVQNEGYKHRLIDCYISLADITNSQSQFSISTYWAQNAHKELEYLSKNHPENGFEYDFCRIELCLGNASSGANALNWYNKAIADAEKLVGRCPTKRNHLLLGFSYMLLGDLFYKEENFNGACTWYKKSISKYINVIDENSTVEQKRELADLYKHLAEAEKRLNNSENAEIYFQKELSVRKLIADFGIEVSTAYDTIVKVAEAEITADEAAQIPSSKTVIDPEDLENLSNCYIELGECTEENSPKTAFKHYMKCLEIRENLFSKHSNVYTAKLLLEIYKKLGELNKNQKNYGMSKKWFEKSIPLLELIISECSELAFRRDLLLCYLEIGELFEETGELESAIIHYERSLQFCNGIYTKDDSTEEIIIMLLFTHAFCYHSAKILYSQKKYKKAKAWIEKATHKLEQVYPKMEISSNEKQLIEAYQLALDIAQKNCDIRSIIKYKNKIKELKQRNT